MSSDREGEGSVTRWIGDVKDGDRDAMERLWARYFQRLAALARRQLKSSRRAPGAVDEEDVALSALNNLWDRISTGELPDVRGRDELWRLLVVIAARKVIGHVRHEGRQKRGSDRVVDEARLATALGGDDADVRAQFVAAEPTPEFVAMVAEETVKRLDSLPDPILRQVAILRMEGHSNPEIAAKLGCVVRTIERKLDVIRSLWGAESAP
jgi:DNA-directed RNA polymerase specialized sigma24 family protein